MEKGLNRRYAFEFNKFDLFDKVLPKLGSICIHDFIPGDVIKIAFLKESYAKVAIAYRTYEGDSGK